MDDLNLAKKEETTLLKRRSSQGDQPYRDHEIKSPVLKFLLGRADAGNIFEVKNTVNTPNNDFQHRICLTEVAPSHSSIIGNDSREDWKLSISEFSSKKHGKSSKDVPKRIRCHEEYRRNGRKTSKS